jgi:hypothetical protein
MSTPTGFAQSGVFQVGDAVPFSLDSQPLKPYLLRLMVKRYEYSE